MKKLLRNFTVLILFFYFSESYAQSSLSQEVGVFFGAASFQTDFGERYDFPSANASTMAFGVTHYLKFFGSQYSWRSGTSYFSEHFKLKTQFLYTFNTNVEHKGSYVKQNTPDAEKLRAMTGEIRMYDIGTNMEFYFLPLEDYSSYYRSSGTLNPFISVGISYTMFDPDIKVNGNSLEGQSEPYTQLIDKWQTGAVHLDPSNSFAVAAGAGVRYSLDKFDLVLDSKYQHFFTDDLDGLNAPDDPANKKNDTMIMVNIGIVYVFGKN